ncbi:MAG: hypothetical protein V2A71_08690 [Candidatus Eisenbacteria bacterium]
MIVTALCVRPIGSDLVALSAFDTLARKMQYAGVLSSIWREELWLLGFCCTAVEARSITERLATETGIFVNPNTHRHVVVAGDEPLPFGKASGREDVSILVWSFDDTQSVPVKVAIRERMGLEALSELKRLTVWWPRFDEKGLCGISPCEAASSMATARSRKEGLLANPHYQGSLVLEGTVSPGELLARITSSRFA